MTKSLKLITLMVATIAFVTINMAMIQKPGGPWDVPAKYKTMKNPLKATDASINSVGKQLYNQHCKSCHGAKGIGDGPKAAKLNTHTGDFSSKEFQANSDGVLYYMSFVGRDEMPNFEKKISDDLDRWAVVSYVRSLKK